MKESNLIKFKLIWMLLLIIAITGIKLVQRKSYSTNEKIDFCSDEEISIYYKYSNFKWYGVFHYGIGLDDPKFILKFTFKKNEYIWKSKIVPIVLNCFTSNIYIIALDQFTNPNKMVFRYYKFDNKWIEIKSEEFPKSIAIQNIGLEKENGFINGKVLDEHEMIKELDTSFGPFQRSLTAKIWFELGTGTQYYKAPDKISEVFLREYKKSYIPLISSSKKDSGINNLGLGLNKIFGGTDSKYRKTGRDYTYFDIERAYYFLILLVILMLMIFMTKYICGKMIKKTNDQNKILRIKDIQLFLIVASIVLVIYLILFDFIAAIVDMFLL